jgi:hypothetical protein
MSEPREVAAHRLEVKSLPTVLLVVTGPSGTSATLLIRSDLQAFRHSIGGSQLAPRLVNIMTPLNEFSKGRR